MTTIEIIYTIGFIATILLIMWAGITREKVVWDGGERRESNEDVPEHFPLYSRLKMEQSELEKRIDDLFTFLTSLEYRYLSQRQQQLLKEQLNVMRQYNMLLKSRITQVEIEQDEK